MNTNEEIKRLNDILLLVRKAVGWSAEEFGEKIGVTRQTINNLESHRCNLTKTQYIAMRSVLDVEIENNPEDTEMLKCLLDAFVDNPDNYSKKDKDEIYQKASLLSPAITSNPSTRKEISKQWKAILIGLGIASVIGIPAIVIGAWKKKI